MIVAESGTHFDPRVIEAFTAIPDETFERIRRETG
jgi:response regulator RpfG family c-di-GMP phosphodiesterase